MVGGADGERDPLKLYGGGDEGVVRREVVAITHAVEGDGDGARRGVKVACGVLGCPAFSGLAWATCFEWN